MLKIKLKTDSINPNKLYLLHINNSFGKTSNKYAKTTSDKNKLKYDFYIPQITISNYITFTRYEKMIHDPHKMTK